MFSVRSCKNLPSDFREEMAAALDKIAENGYIPVFIPMQLKADLELSRQVAAAMKYPSRIIDREIPVREMLAIIGRSTIACGMRLHMLIFASVVNVPMAGIAYDPKIKGFMEYMNQKTYIELENFSKEEFSDMAMECIGNVSAIKEALEKASVQLREKAKQNACFAIDLIK